MMKGGPKQFPNLSTYLENATKPRAANAGVVVQAILAATGSISFLTCASLALGEFFAHRFDLVALHVVQAVFFAGACALGVVAAQKLIPRRVKPTPLQLEAREVNSLLKNHLRERRLHKAGPEAVTMLLEEAARQYLRIQASLASNFWRTAELPPQYAALREKARLASDRAMNETVVLLRPRLTEIVKPQHWKDVVDEVAENLGLKAPDRGFVFPGELEPARKLAEGLRGLANEVEQASIRAITDIPNSNSADATLRSCLSELRALNEAESELDDSLRYRL
jgi:hypothetical protein